MGIKVEYNSQDMWTSRTVFLSFNIPVRFNPFLSRSSRVWNENFCTRIYGAKARALSRFQFESSQNFSSLHSYLWKCPRQKMSSFAPRNHKPFKRYIRKFSSHGESFAKWSRKSARILVLSASGDSSSQSDRFALSYCLLFIVLFAKKLYKSNKI